MDRANSHRCDSTSALVGSLASFVFDSDCFEIALFLLVIGKRGFTVNADETPREEKNVAGKTVGHVSDTRRGWTG